jgi:hypothetical protein
LPVHYRYDEAERRLYTRCEGEVTLTEVIGHFRELTGITRLHPDSDVLLDLTFQTNLPRHQNIDAAANALEEIHYLVQLGRCAVVAPTPLATEIGRRFQAVTWPLYSGLRLFGSSADATAWLNS